MKSEGATGDPGAEEATVFPGRSAFHQQVLTKHLLRAPQQPSYLARAHGLLGEISQRHKAVSAVLLRVRPHDHRRSANGLH